jgi:hypothetical protein
MSSKRGGSFDTFFTAADPLSCCSYSVFWRVPSLAADVLLHWHGSALSVQAVILQSVSGAAASGDRNALTKMNCFMLDLKWQFLPSDDLVWSGVVRGVPVGSTIGIAWLVESNWRPDCRAPQTPPLHESQVRVCSPHFTHWPGRFHTAISTV